MKSFRYRVIAASIKYEHLSDCCKYDVPVTDTNKGGNKQVPTETDVQKAQDELEFRKIEYDYMFNQAAGNAVKPHGLPLSADKIATYKELHEKNSTFEMFAKEILDLQLPAETTNNAEKRTGFFEKIFAH